MISVGSKGGADAATACFIAWATSLAACAVAQPEAPPVPPGLADADSLEVVDVEPGVRYFHARWEQGPWAVDIVEIDRDVCRPVFLARKPGPDLAGRETTSRIAQDAGDLVSINADFFRLPGGTPVGAHVERGAPLIGPSDRQIVAFDDDGAWIGIASIAGSAVHAGDTVRVTQVNRSPVAFSAYAGTTDGVSLFSHWIGDTIPRGTQTRIVRLRRIDGDEAAGRGLVTAVNATAAEGAVVGAGVGADEVVLMAHGDARQWAARRTAGDTVVWSVAVVPRSPQPGAGPAREAVGGFPELLRAGREVLGEQTVRTEFGEQRHPRSAIGWTDGMRRVYLVTVDGRQPPWSDGMTLAELTSLFQRLDVSDALNLDGGGSTALVIRGEVVNRPSDATGERPVGNALSLARCAD